jgi:hypothetical protein
MNLGKALGFPVDVYKYIPDNRLVLSNCRVGVEFEFEGVRADLPAEPWAAYWEAKLDRSLHDKGMEFVFKRPLFGADAIEAVVSLCKWASENKFKVSLRTGLHVHVDVRDLSRVELSRLIVLFALFEKGVYRFVGHAREQNVFCMPWYQSDRMAQHALNIGSENYDIRSASEALANEKYGGLNLDSLARFGSVEFRHAIATTDSDWVLSWINLCLSFKRAAQKLDASPLQLIHSMSAVGVEGFAKRVFEDQLPSIWYPEMEHDVWATGIETALAVLPRQQEVLDKADLSWNKKQQKKIAVTNPSYAAYLKEHASKKDDGEPAPVKQPFYRGIVIDDWNDQEFRIPPLNIPRADGGAV